MSSCTVDTGDLLSVSIGIFAAAATLIAIAPVAISYLKEQSFGSGSMGRAGRLRLSIRFLIASLVISQAVAIFGLLVESASHDIVLVSRIALVCASLLLTAACVILVSQISEALTKKR